MDDDLGAIVLQRKARPLLQNRMIPKIIDAEISFLIEDGSNIEDQKFEDQERTHRSDKASPRKESASYIQRFPPIQQQTEKTIESEIQLLSKDDQYEFGFYIVLNQQQLSVHQGNSKAGRLMHYFSFPHGAEYSFNDSDKILIITDKNGQKINLIINEDQSFKDMKMDWHRTKFLSDFDRESDDKSTDIYDGFNYCFAINHLSKNEFSNVYNENYMRSFQFYSNIDGKPQIQNSVDFEHYYRPNRMLTSFNYVYDDETKKHLRDRELIQWAPSRDWSRLFLLSKSNNQDGFHDLYLEFYDFDSEENNMLSLPQRMSQLSQLLRPQWIKKIDEKIKIHPNIQIEASFTNNRIAIMHDEKDQKFRLRIFDLNPDYKIGTNEFIILIDESNIESFSFSCSKLIIKSNGIYYENNEQIKKEELAYSCLNKYFSKTNLKNLIQCGIYDILVYEQHVKIFNNIIPSNKLDQVAAKDDLIKLLKTQNFIQLDDSSIACLQLPLESHNFIQIVEISQDNLILRESFKIKLKSPKENEFTDSQFKLVKFKKFKYAAVIVTSQKWKGQFYQYYREQRRQLETIYQLEYSKYYKDCITLKQIPHLPLMNIYDNIFINCEMIQNHNHQEFDIQKDQCEILNQDFENIYSQDVYSSSFKRNLFGLIEEKENIIDRCVLYDQNFYSIEIPELKTSIEIRQDAEINAITGIQIFQPSIKKIKHLKLKQPMIYATHKVIFSESAYDVSIILFTKENAFYEISMRFNQTGVTLTPYNFKMKMIEAQKLHKIHLSDDFRLSLILIDQKVTTDYSFAQYQWDLKTKFWSEHGETIKFQIKDRKIQAKVPDVKLIVQWVAQNQSIKIAGSILEQFVSIITKNYVDKFERDNECNIIEFQNKFILFEPKMEHITILDDSFTVISTVILNLDAPLYQIRIAPELDLGALEYIDAFNSKFPFPIQGKIEYHDTYNQRLDKYTNDFRYPMPFQFGLHDGFISRLDLKTDILLFFQSESHQKDGNISARIEVIQQKQSFMDDIINSNERKNIEDIINQTEINLLLSYNINKRMNLITGTKYHDEKDLIYSALYKRIQIAETKELPMLIYNTSLNSKKYESILDVLAENKEFKLAQLIVSIAIKQDHIGYIYSNLGPYLSIFSETELNMYLDSQIFFFQISTDFYDEYQNQQDTLIRPNSAYDSFPKIQKNMKELEKQILQDCKIIEEPPQVSNLQNHQLKVSMNKKQTKRYNQEMIFQGVSAPIEYYAIDLRQLQQFKPKLQPQIQYEVSVTQRLNQLVETEPLILEIESIQIIIDFKWQSYAWKFFSVQLILFSCFIIAFIFDIVAVSNNSKLFESNDPNQVIPRITSIAILIPFAIYELYNFLGHIRRYCANPWNANDLLLIIFYAAYFILSFYKPEYEYGLKSLQLLIVIFSFIKFSFLIRIWTQVSFLVRMLIVVFKELLIFLFYFLLVIGGLTVMAQIIVKESGEGYKGIKVAAYFVIVLRQAIGDYDTSSIIEGTKDFKILAWLLWFIILVIGNIVFMNFIIAVVSESYENCMEQKIQLIYKAKLEMIEECEDLMPNSFFAKKNLFPDFIIIRRKQGSSQGGQNNDEWQGFVKQIKRHLEQETYKLNDMFIQNINRSTNSTQKEMKSGLEKVKKDTADLVEREVKVVRDEINEIKQILSAVFKDQIAANNAKEVQKIINKAV